MSEENDIESIPNDGSDAFSGSVPQVDLDGPRLSAGEWAERRANRSKPHGLKAFRKWLRELPVWQRWAVGIPSAIIALLVVALVVEAAASVGRIHPGVAVGGVGLGGLTRERAEERLAEELGPRLDEPVVLRLDEQQWSVEATQVAASLLTTTAVDAAFEVGRSGGFWVAAGERLSAWFAEVNLPAAVAGDADLVSAVVDEVGTSVDRAPKDASVVIEGTEARVDPSELGLAVRRDEVAVDMLSAFAETDRTVDVAAEFVPVQVTDEDAERAAQDARTMMSGPVTVTYEGDSWEFQAQEIAGWIAFRTVTPESVESSAALDLAGEPETVSGEEESVSATSVPGVTKMALEAFIDPTKASGTVTPRVGTAGRPAENARFKAGGGQVSIIPSQDGVGPDIGALAVELTTVLLGDGERSVTLRTQRVEPDITTEDAQAMGIKERISTYTTTYESGNAPRVNNIHTLADALDGALVAPGGTFSFNETIGPRTAEKGYQEAPAIVNGKLVPQLGGGICQVGTTIFNSVFESGLPVVERKNHSFYISHYPAGRDATVSWGGPDFKFKNDTPNYVLVATGYSNSSLTISIYGTDPGYEVKATTGAFYDIVAFPVEEVEDPTMPEGSQVVEDSGVNGRKIVVTRKVYQNGSLLREDKFTSIYKTKTQVLRVGTMPVATEASATPAPQP